MFDLYYGMLFLSMTYWIFRCRIKTQKLESKKQKNIAANTMSGIKQKFKTPPTKIDVLEDKPFENLNLPYPARAAVKTIQLP